jgi:hypothetical protein
MLLVPVSVFGGRVQNLPHAVQLCAHPGSSQGELGDGAGWFMCFVDESDSLDRRAQSEDRSPLLSVRPVRPGPLISGVKYTRVDALAPELGTKVLTQRNAEGWGHLKTECQKPPFPPPHVNSQQHIKLKAFKVPNSESL